MAESFQKKEREKKRRKRKQEKAERKALKKEQDKKGPEFMYVDKFGNLTDTPPEHNVADDISLEDIQISTPKGNFREDKFINTGIVKFLKEEEGYGFIKDTQTSKEYFFRLAESEGDIKVHLKVTFQIGSSPKGPVANSVKLKT